VTPGCEAFSWVSGPKYCYLKNKIGTAVADMSVWGGQKIAGPASSKTTTTTAAAQKRTAIWGWE